MTNHEYILETLSSMNERQLAELIEGNEFRNKIETARMIWARSIANDNKGNQYFSEFNHPSYYFYQMWYNRKNKQWEKRGRTSLVSLQQFLSAQFDKSYWE